MRDRIIQIICDITENDDIKNNSQIDILEEVLDSLSFMELVASLEEEFNIEIELSQVKSEVWRNVDSIVQMVNNYLKE